MVTFTLPAELRPLAWHNQTIIYNAIMRAATETIKQFGLTSKRLGGAMGMTAVLHTHSRCLDYHPHVHLVVPGGCLDIHKRKWRKVCKFLFYGDALAKVFRGKFLHEIGKKELIAPSNTPKEWIVDCRSTGRGEPALEYLSRYLYRGVIGESNIIANQDGKVTFRYIDGNTKQTCTETLDGEDFLWKVIQHVLPRGFHRVRDYGFLHHNSRILLHRVQLLFSMKIHPKEERVRPCFCCRECGGAMIFAGFLRHQMSFKADAPPVTAGVT